jgi:hypothetical protein
MKTNVIFRGFEGFDHLKTFVQDTIEHSIGKLDLGNVQEIKVIVGTTHSRRLGHPPDFSCEAVMKTRKRTFFAKKMDLDFHSAVRKCAKALSKIFINTNRNARDKRRSIDRHQSAFLFNQSDDTLVA